MAMSTVDIASTTAQEIDAEVTRDPQKLSAMRFSKRRAMSVFALADKDGDGMLSADEYAKVTAAQADQCQLIMSTARGAARCLAFAHLPSTVSACRCTTSIKFRQRRWRTRRWR